jgi:hypothetical protein
MKAHSFPCRESIFFSMAILCMVVWELSILVDLSFLYFFTIRVKAAIFSTGCFGKLCEAKTE